MFSSSEKLLLQMGGLRFVLVGLCVALCLCWCAPNVQGQVTDAQEGHILKQPFLPHHHLMCFSSLDIQNHMFVCYAVTALLAVRARLKDPYKNLNWTRKFDPCAANWTGVKCYSNASDGYLHVEELYALFLSLLIDIIPFAFINHVPK